MRGCAGVASASTTSLRARCARAPAWLAHSKMPASACGRQAYCVPPACHFGVREPCSRGARPTGAGYNGRSARSQQVTWRPPGWVARSARCASLAGALQNARFGVREPGLLCTTSMPLWSAGAMLPRRPSHGRRLQRQVCAVPAGHVEASGLGGARCARASLAGACQKRFGLPVSIPAQAAADAPVLCGRLSQLTQRGGRLIIPDHLQRAQIGTELLHSSSAAEHDIDPGLG